MHGKHLPFPLDAFYDATQRGSADRLLSLLTDDFVGHVTEGLPGIGGTHVGGQTMLRRVWGPAHTRYRVVPRPSDSIHGSDGRFAVLGRYHGEPPETGRTFEAQFCHVFRVDRGRIAELRQITDSQRWVEAVTPTDEDTSTVRRVFDAVRARDLPSLLDAYASDVIIEEDPALPYGGTHHGHDGAMEHSARFARTWDGLQSESERDPRETILVAPGGAVALWTLRASRGSERLAQLAASVFELRDGRVAHLRMLHLDTSAILQFLHGEAAGS